MSNKLNVETFVAVLKKSGLVDAERLKRALADYTASGHQVGDSASLSEFLISNSIITRWQAEKLLQGKQRGYFLGKYKLLSLLGKGGMSSVYLAEHTVMRRRCALKVLPTKRVNDSSYLARFHREAQAVAALDHPNIVRAYDVDQQSDRDNEIHFLVMEYVEGDSLQDLVQKNGVCGLLDAAEYIRQSALGLQHAHEAGMVHRDVKPGNLLVDTNGVVKVLDLGLAILFSTEEQGESLTVAHDEKVLGTADYLSPEQALDSHQVDARADIYSLGCTLYFLLTGRPPFTEGTLTQRLMAHQTKTPPAVESLRKEVTPELAKIIRKMMSKKPEERYQTAKETADALFTWVDANADDRWRKEHSTAYGSSRSGVGASGSAAIPVAKPIVAQPVISFPVSAPVVNEAPAVSSDFDFSSLASPPPPAPTSTKTEGTGSSKSVVKKEAAKNVVAQSVAASGGGLDDFLSAMSGVGHATADTAIGADAFNFGEPSPTDTAKAASTSNTHKEPAKKATSPAKSSPKQPVMAPPSKAVEATSFDLPFSVPEPSTAAPVTLLPDFGVPDVAASIASPVQVDSTPTALPAEAVSTTPAKPASKSKPKAKASGGKAVLSPTVRIVAVVGIAAAIGLMVVARQMMSGGGGATSNLAKKAVWTEDDRKITVGGPKGQFKTITDALKAVREKYRPVDDTDSMEIRIAAGTYAERISMDGSPATGGSSKSGGKPASRAWPKGIHLIANGEVTLEPEGDKPVIRIKQVSRLTIEGITINANGRPTAVELVGDLKDTELKNCSIQNFTESGITCLGARGSAFGSDRHEAVLEGLTLTAAEGASNAVGIQIRDESDRLFVSNLLVQSCRFMGPLGAGVTIAGKGPNNIVLSGNIFHQVQHGIRFEDPATWNDIAITNNTFHEGKVGIAFKKNPDGYSSNLIVRRNLFAKLTEADGMVLAEYDEKLFNNKIAASPPGFEHNYSTAAPPNPAKKGELSQLFNTKGKRDAKEIVFSSTDPVDDSFLAPAEKAVQRNVALETDQATRTLREKPWVGAIGP